MQVQNIVLTNVVYHLVKGYNAMHQGEENNYIWDLYIYLIFPIMIDNKFAMVDPY